MKHLCFFLKSSLAISEIASHAVWLWALNSASELQAKISSSTGHFRVPKALTFKMRPGALPFLWKWVLFAWEWKIIFISKAEHLTSFWYRGPGELGNGLLATLRLCGRPGRRWMSSALWDYFGGRIFNMVANSSSKQSHNTLWQPSQTGLPRNLKVADRVFSDDVTAAMLVSQSSPVGGELVCYANAFVCCNKFAHMLATWVKTLYKPA